MTKHTNIPDAHLSKMAYDVAEAMLAEREKRIKAQDKTWQEEH